MTTEQYQSLKTTVQKLYHHPKASAYAKTYASALLDGRVSSVALAHRIPLKDAVRSQILYILSNVKRDKKFPDWNATIEEIIVARDSFLKRA